MKKMVAVLVSLMVVACNSNPSTHTSSAAQAGTKPATQAATPAGADQGTVAANDQASVYFDKNNSAVAPEYRALIQKEAAAIKGQIFAIFSRFTYSRPVPFGAYSHLCSDVPK